MPARPGRRASCGPRFFTTTSWLPSTSSTCSATRCAALRKITTGGLALLLAARGARLQQRARPEEGQLLAGELEACRCCRPAALPSAARAHQFHQVGRHADRQLARAHHHHLRHGGGQRQHQLEAGAAARPACGLDAAAERVDCGAHHVHADAAAGQFGHLRGGGETGHEDQVGGVAFGLTAPGRAAIRPCCGLLADARRSRPAPSSRKSTETSLPSWRRWM
jgi:hypothetical protein